MESFLIYVLEDDEDIAKIIEKTLSKQGYRVHTFSLASSFFEAFYKEESDLLLLDLMLPDMDGFRVLQKVRTEEQRSIEIIILSAKRMLMDKVEGLDLGADDYMEKPFDLLELMSRVNARLRKHKKDSLQYLDIRVDRKKHQTFLLEKEIYLTNKEFDILVYFLRHVHEVVTREDLLKHIWGENQGYESRTIDMHVKSLREKLNDKEGEYIQTIYGVGYRMGK